MDTLEQELLTLLHDLRCSPRQARALAIRLGWDGAGGATLAEAGAAEGYTRERVRQLEGRVRARMAAAPPALPLTTRAVDLIAALAPAPRGAIAERLVAAGIAERPFDPEGVLRAAELAGSAAPVVVEGDFVLGGDEVELVSATRRLVSRLARRSGPVRLRAVAARLSAEPEAVRQLLDVQADIRWLDPDREWLALPHARSRPARAIEKMLAVAGPLPLAELDDGLRRSVQPLFLPRDLLRAWCRALPWLELDADADVVRPRVPLEPRRVLTPLERALVAIVREHPRLRVSEVGRLAEEAGLNSTSAMLYLARSPLFRTIARGRYELRGGGGRLVAAA